LTSNLAKWPGQATVNIPMVKLPASVDFSSHWFRQKILFAMHLRDLNRYLLWHYCLVMMIELKINNNEKRNCEFIQGGFDPDDYCIDSVVVWLQSLQYG